MFIDASALVAILAGESDGTSLLGKVSKTPDLFVSGLVIYESVTALLRLNKKSKADTLDVVNDFILIYDIEFMSFGDDVHELALDAFERFGKGRHPAGLNMGDCFSYACAKKLQTSLLFKGNDFSKTDILKA